MTDWDPIEMEILWSRLVNIAEECWTTIAKTAFSTVIGESQDFGCELLDRRGQSLVHSPRSTPAFTVAMPRALAALLERFPIESLEDGDVLITNDPWICNGHLSDVALLTPVFRGSELVAFSGSTAHWSDIGGTLDSLHAREIFEEGIQIPPMKAWSQGQPNETLLELIRTNTRQGDIVLGDLNAQYVANDVGRRRLLDFMSEYQLSSLDAFGAAIQGRAELVMRAAIRQIPNGVYRNRVQMDALGTALTIPVAVIVDDDTLVVDYDGAPPQVTQGAINCPISFTTAHTLFAIKCLLTPDIRSNAGCYRPIEVRAPVGSILNCTWPSAVNLRTLTGWFSAPSVYGAVAAAVPDLVQAFTAKPIAVTTYGRRGDGSVFNDYLLWGGGQGASSRRDGKSAVIFPPSAAGTSVEVAESRSDILFDCKALIPDSGGAGRHRGGLGQRIRLRKLGDPREAVLLSLQPPDVHLAVPGLQGGQAGASYRVLLEREAGGGPQSAASSQGVAVLRDAGDSITFELGGGHGFGDPLERALELVQADHEARYVTAAGLGAYGCTVDAAGRVSRVEERPSVVDGASTEER